jgi:DNA topoisomerase-1
VHVIVLSGSRNNEASFARALPRIRARVEKDLRRPGLPRQKVLATVIKLLETSLIRVGNEQYAKANNSFGLTTMRNRHITINGASALFRFRGKSGKEHKIKVTDRRLATVVRKTTEPDPEYRDVRRKISTLDTCA